MTTQQGRGAVDREIDEDDDSDEAIAVGSGGIVQYLSPVVLKIAAVLIVLMVILAAVVRAVAVN